MESGPSGLITLLPLILLSIPIGIVNLILGSRKGLGIAFKIGGFVPLVQYYLWMYVVGLTDKVVFDQLLRIENKLGAGAN